MMKLHAKLISILFLITATNTAIAATVIKDGKEWMQLTSTTLTSYTDMSRQCSTTSGICTSGTNNDGGSLIGWTWASNEDVASLFDSYILGASVTDDLAGVNTGVYFHKTQLDSSWAPDFFLDFEVTSFNAGVDWTFGMTRTLIDIPYTRSLSTIAYMMLIWQDKSDDVAAIHRWARLFHANEGVGHWLYKDVSAVPIPATVFMFTPALLGFLGLHSRVKNTVV